MFLSKKNALFLNKPAKNKIIPTRVLPGWGDEEDAEEQNNFKPETRNNNNSRKNTSNLLGEEEIESPQINPQTTGKSGKDGKKSYYNWDELNDMTGMYHLLYVDNMRKS